MEEDVRRLRVVVGVILYEPGWIGVTADKNLWDYLSFADKRLWDYLDLLIVPAVLVLAAYWLTRRQEKQQEATEAARRDRELEIENRRAQDEAVQKYFDQMSRMLLDKERVRCVGRRLRGTTN